MAQQHWEAERLRVDATKIAAYTSTLLHGEFRTLGNEVLKEDEFCHDTMQEFAIQAEEALDAEMRSLVQEAGWNSVRTSLSTDTLVKTLESKTQDQDSEFSIQNSDLEPAQRQESFLVPEVRNRERERHQAVTLVK